MRGLVGLGAALGLLVIGGVEAAPNPSGGALHSSMQLEIPIAGEFGVPVDAKMVALHVGVARSAGPGHATLWPCDDEPPNTSVVNFGRAQLTQSLVLARLSAEGSVCVTGHETTDFIIDLAGYVPADSDLVPLDEPTRIVNTRRSQQVRAGETLPVQIGGREGVDSDADAAAFTVTVAQGSGPGHLSVVPCGEPTDRTSTVNWPAGKAVPNFVIARLGDAGSVCITPTTDVHVFVDLVAWVPNGGTGYQLLDQPRRTFDSRSGIGTTARPLAAAETRPIPVAAPAGAVAVIGNVTAARQPRAGFATLVGCGTSVGRGSSLNWSGAPAVANMSLAPLGDGRQPCVTAAFPTDVVFDVTGYVTSPDFFTPLAIQRLVDTRRGWEAQCDFVPLVLPGSGPRLLVHGLDGDWSDDRRLPVSSDARSAVVTPTCEIVIPTFDRVQFIDPETGSGRSVAARVTGDVVAVADGRLLSVEFRFVRALPGGVLFEFELVVTDVLSSKEVSPPTSRIGPALGEFDLRRASLSEDGRTIAVIEVIGGEQSVSIVDLHDGLLSEFQIGPYREIYGFDVAPDGASVVISGAPAGDIGTAAQYDVYSAAGVRFDGAFGGMETSATFRGAGSLFVCDDDGEELVIGTHDLFGEFVEVERRPFIADDSQLTLLTACRTRPDAFSWFTAP